MRIGKYLSLTFAITLTAILSACGGSSSGNPSGSGSNPPGTNVAFVFAGGVNPTAVAMQIGTGSWAKASTPTNGQLTVNVPNGTTNYAIAYVCPTWQGMSPVNQEFVIEATINDGTAFNLSCYQNPSVGQATGSANGTAIPSVTGLTIAGSAGNQYMSHPSGSFSTTFAKGTNDIAVVALDNSFDVLGVKIVRSQTVPGVINSGNSITLASTDETRAQSLAVTNIPSGFVSPASVSAQYHTAGGTSFGLLGNNNQTRYAAIPSTESQAGDYYFFTANTSNSSNENLYVTTTTSSAGSVTLQMPTPLPYAPPTPAALPSFTINYNGFSGMAASGDFVTVQWFVQSSTLEYLSVYATSSYLNGATTLAVPDLSSLTGFFQSPASGSMVDWAAEVYGGSYHYFATTPSTGSIAVAEARGNYNVP